MVIIFYDIGIIVIAGLFIMAMMGSGVSSVFDALPNYINQIALFLVVTQVFKQFWLYKHVQKESYRGRFQYKGEIYTKDNTDLKKLIQEMEDLRYEVKHELKGKGDSITLDTWFDVWLNIHKRRTIKESTRVRYDDFYHRYMQKQIGRQGYSTKPIRDVYNILNAMFKYAVHNH